MTIKPNEQATQAEPAWLLVARDEIGEAELAGTAANRRILGYFGSTRLAPEADEVPWCAAFVGWCLKEAGLQGTGKASARSYLDWGVALTQPRLGCVVVFKRGDNKAQGHVGLYVGETQETIRVLGGNQGNRVCIAPYAKARLLAYRWPEGVP